VFDFHADPAKDKDPWFQVAPWEIERVCRAPEDEQGLSFDYLECMTGSTTRTSGKIHVVLHVYSYALRTAWCSSVSSIGTTR
jgi:NADH-quinone oxidoreductase subunit C